MGMVFFSFLFSLVVKLFGFKSSYCFGLSESVLLHLPDMHNSSELLIVTGFLIARQTSFLQKNFGFMYFGCLVGSFFWLGLSSQFSCHSMANMNS